MTSVEIHKFKAREMVKKPFNAVILGRKHTGKSCLILDLLYHLSRERVPRIAVFSGTEAANHFFSKYVPDSFIYNNFDLDVFTAIVNFQKDIAMKKAIGEIHPATDTRIVLLLDDCAFDKKVFKSEVIREIFFNGRHHGIYFILSAQYLMDISCDLRTNIDYLFCLKENIPRNTAKLYENFFGAFQNIHEFRSIFDKCTQDFECLVQNNTKPTTDISETVFWYKAKLSPSFRFGSPKLWQFHEARYLSDEERYQQMQSETGQMRRGKKKAVFEKVT
jgi:hypothetical protein